MMDTTKLTDRQQSCLHPVMDAKGHCEWCGARNDQILGTAVGNTTSDECPFCRLASVRYEQVLDMNVCIACGARETSVGWKAGNVTKTEEPPVSQ